MSHAIKEPERASMSVDEFLARVKPVSKVINISELGDVRIRAITLQERQEIISGSTVGMGGKVDDALFIAITVIKGVVEPALTPTHIAQLKESNFGILARLSKQIWKMSGVEEDAKNA